MGKGKLQTFVGINVNNTNEIANEAPPNYSNHFYTPLQVDTQG
jgi:hypothetical protein